LAPTEPRTNDRDAYGMVFSFAMSRELCSPIKALSCHTPGKAHMSFQRLVLNRASVVLAPPYAPLPMLGDTIG